MNIRSLITTLCSDTFLVSLFVYLAFVRIDLSFEGFISRAFNMSILLVVCILSGIGTVLLASEQKEHDENTAPRRSWLYASAVSILIGSIVYQIVLPLSSWAVLMALTATSIVFLTCFVMIRGYGTDH